MKRIIKASLILVFIGIFVTNVFAAQQPKILVNSSEVQLENPLIKKNGNVYISLRDIANIMGYEFSWSQDIQTANLKNDSVIIALKANNIWYTKKTLNGVVRTFKLNSQDVPIMVDGRLYVTVGNFTIVADGMIEWDSSTATYNIMCNAKLNYMNNIKTQLYAGTGKKGNLDGALKESQLTYAQSIFTAKNKDVYISDAGAIRKISNGMLETLKMEPSNIKVTQLRGIDNDVYALSTLYENAAKKKVYSIFKLDGTTFKEVYAQEGSKNKIVDFDLVSNKVMSVLKQNVSTGEKTLEIIDLTTGKVTAASSVDQAFGSIAASGKKVYLGNKEKGSIYSYDIKTKEISLFAGTEDKHQFVDGNDALFCAPRRLKYYNGKLYVLDYNVIRKITINNDVAGNCETVAGKVTAATNPVTDSSAGKNIALSSVNPIDFAVSDEGILLTDANQYKVIKISQ